MQPFCFVCQLASDMIASDVAAPNAALKFSLVLVSCCIIFLCDPIRSISGLKTKISVSLRTGLAGCHDSAISPLTFLIVAALSSRNCARIHRHLWCELILFPCLFFQFGRASDCKCIYSFHARLLRNCTRKSPCVLFHAVLFALLLSRDVGCSGC